MTDLHLPVGKKEQAKITVPERLDQPAIGMEAEFALVVDDEQADPVKVFGSPAAFIRDSGPHRLGSSYHIPTGGAVYFDTGVIEVVTPVIEIEPHCAARAVRSLWEGIHYVRGELDDWEARTGRSARLVGFSTHYNVSLDGLLDESGERSSSKLAMLLTHILAVPVMMLAANRKSTGVGVRPRGERVEVTVDFTPSPALMVATATLVTAVIREVATWPSFDLSALDRRRIPRIKGFHPVPHTSRQGWLARNTCFPENPFTAPVDRIQWPLVGGGWASLRQIARRCVRPFRHPIREIGDRPTLNLLYAVLRKRKPSLLDLIDRPAEYEDVGRLCGWNDLYLDTQLRRSRYEEVLIRTTAGQRVAIHGEVFRTRGTQGWSRVVLESERTGRRQVVGIDYLVTQRPRWL
jgi:hypothetical protein